MVEYRSCKANVIGSIPIVGLLSHIKLSTEINSKNNRLFLLHSQVLSLYPMSTMKDKPTI